jgi:MerR family transcriptional regulator, light-induced transcriptional regulator
MTESNAVHLFLSPRDLGKAVGVSESSVKRWIDAGRIQSHRTAGGHRRVALGEAIQFVREAGLPLVRPELLGLRGIASGGAGELAVQRGEQLLGLLREGESAEVRGLLLSWYLDGTRIAELADGPLCSSLEALGELWRHGDDGIVIEHRATDICLQAVTQLRLLLPAAAEEAPLAVGGSPDLDLFGSQLACAVIAEAGWRSINLGAQTPPDILARAVEDLRPRLAWLSLTHLEAADGLGSRIGCLLDVLDRTDGVLIVGGRSRRRAGLPSHPRLHEGDSMADLAGFARGLLESFVPSSV